MPGCVTGVSPKTDTGVPPLTQLSLVAAALPAKAGTSVSRGMRSPHLRG